LPEFDRYLLDYPNVNLPNVQTEFYWEKVNFGLKPTLRVVQAIIYRASSPATALDLTICTKDQERSKQRGFYLSL